SGRTARRADSTFRLLRAKAKSTRAWAFAKASSFPMMVGDQDKLPYLRFRILIEQIEARFVTSARRVGWGFETPECLLVEGVGAGSEEAGGSNPPDDMVMITELFDPEWRGVWFGPNGERAAEVLPVFEFPGLSTGWLGVKVPGPGRWTLHLRYEGRTAWMSLG